MEKELLEKDIPWGYPLCFNGENMLWPKQQEEIMKIVAEFGSTEGVKFDHYVTDWNFEY